MGYQWGFFIDSRHTVNDATAKKMVEGFIDF
jgi:hypothetical protein